MILNSKSSLMGPKNKMALIACLAMVGISALSTKAVSETAGIRNGDIVIDATMTDVQLCTGDYEELGLDSTSTPVPFVFFGDMTGAFGSSSVEVDLFTDQGALGDTTFGCQSAYAAICIPNDPLNRLMTANLTFCRQAHQKLIDGICFGSCPGIFGDILGRSFSVLGGWQLAISNDSSVVNAWGTAQGSLGAASPAEYGKIDRLKLTMKSIVEKSAH